MNCSWFCGKPRQKYWAGVSKCIKIYQAQPNLLRISVIKSMIRVPSIALYYFIYFFHKYEPQNWVFQYIWNDEKLYFDTELTSVMLKCYFSHANNFGLAIQYAIYVGVSRIAASIFVIKQREAQELAGSDIICKHSGLLLVYHDSLYSVDWECWFVVKDSYILIIGIQVMLAGMIMITMTLKQVQLTSHQWSWLTTTASFSFANIKRKSTQYSEQWEGPRNSVKICKGEAQMMGTSTVVHKYKLFKSVTHLPRPRRRPKLAHSD